ncbi:Cof-type HAD-IIB family hydrolase [Acetonema longum]|uniref:Cof-like hydrolase n=1 Tax=Acetonema longum DSM 6540 TaxID=1009370 RepID=F7NN36_9FIRM|nr:Cof-type HAD-IIB family hydrolase [Acetonema longum]EGO62544.1 Cof-like hydrolase [Acetonema longum DSM 6540]
MPIRLVAIDLDDTLLDHQTKVSPRAVEAIRQAMAQGVTVTVATGRMYASALPYARQLNLDVPLITYNGALIKACLSGEVLYHRTIERELAAEIMELFRARDWYIQSYVDDVLYVREVNDQARAYEASAKVKAVPLGESFYTEALPPTKMLALARPEEIREQYRVVKQHFGGRLYAAVSKPTYLEMTHPAVNKGIALSYLAQKLGVDRREVMAIGDSQNDLDMIEFAGWGVAMGNAMDLVKSKADAVTAANDADGVAEAIERYILQENR